MAAEVLGDVERERPPAPLRPIWSFALPADDAILHARMERIAGRLQTLHDSVQRWVTGEEREGAELERTAREVV